MTSLGGEPMTGQPNRSGAFRALRAACALAILAEAGVVEVGLARYMREYSVSAAMAVVGLLAIGAVAVLRRVAGPTRPRVGASAILALLLVVLAVPPASTLWPGGLTHARFGLTVVGLCPIPLFDVVIRSDGRVWFRNKTHHVTVEEARAVLRPDTEHLIVANGWDGAVRVDPEVVSLGAKSKAGLTVEVLRTGEAVERFRRLRGLGVRVALLLHSTC